ncbi:hypothetical protein [Agromyces bauzanensis]
MPNGINDNSDARWSFTFDDGCEITAHGRDRADALGRAEAEHEGCTIHTTACNHLAKLLKATTGVSLQCTGECIRAAELTDLVAS